MLRFTGVILGNGNMIIIPNALKTKKTVHKPEARTKYSRKGMA